MLASFVPSPSTWAWASSHWETAASFAPQTLVSWSQMKLVMMFGFLGFER